ncbi:MAG: ferredoxin [Chloroflexi bacterium]|nr:ferredoxin [Chloroflexota bacterium]
MPRFDQSHPSNAVGPWFVDTRCIRCDAARNWAPGLIGMDEMGRSVIVSQPVAPEQEAAMWRAAAACPTKSIGNLEQPVEPAGIFLTLSPTACSLWAATRSHPSPRILTW